MRSDLLQTVCLFVFAFSVPALASCGRANPLSATYQVDTVRFVASGQGAGKATTLQNAKAAATPTGPAPSIWIDTNIEVSGLFGGTVESTKPYGIRFDYTDNALQFTAVEFLAIEVLYDDALAESGLASLDLPLRFEALDYESVNSVAGGRTVTTVSRVFSGRISGVITRDADFRLRISGRFLREAADPVIFSIDQRYLVLEEVGTKAVGEVLQDW